MDEEHVVRFDRGSEQFRRIHGRSGAQVIEGLADIAPDLGRYVVEFAFGDVYARPGLGVRERQIATVAGLTALATAPAQLKIHIEAALKVGVTPHEVVEVITQMALYAGFPAALNGIAAAREAFASAGVPLPLGDSDEAAGPAD